MPPPGFEPFDRESPLLAPWRPIFMRNEPGQVVLGLEAREAHTNSRGTVHGGLYAALADQAMGLSCGARLRAEGAQVEGCGPPRSASTIWARPGPASGWNFTPCSSTAAAARATPRWTSPPTARRWPGRGRASA